MVLFVFVHLHTIAQIDDRAVQLYCLSLQEMIQKRNNKKMSIHIGLLSEKPHKTSRKL